MARHVRIGSLDLYASSVLEALPLHLRGAFIMKCALSPLLVQEMNEGALDVVCLFTPPANLLRDALTWREEIVWACSRRFAMPAESTLPLIGSPTCAVHLAAADVLEEGGIAYRVVFEGSISLKIAAAEEGFGILPVPRWAVPASLVENDALPAIPPVTAAVCYRDGFDTPDANAVRSALDEMATRFATRTTRRGRSAVPVAPKPTD